jgi:hypothetical protein
VNGIARVLLGTKHVIEQYSINGESSFYKSVAGGSERHDTFTESKIKRLRTHALETNIQCVQGLIPEFMSRIELDGGTLTQSFVNEIHESLRYEHEAINASFAIVIAVAASACTMGAGAVVGGAVAGGLTMTGTAAALTTTMVGAGFSSLCAQAAVSLASNKGDIDKALKSVTSKEALQSVGIAMASAGAAHGINTYFKVPLNPSAITGLTQHAAYHSIAMISNMAAEAAIAGKTDGKGAALKAIASTLGSKLANVIGDFNYAGEIDFFTHKALHALKGAAEGRIVGGKKGMEAGALGAFLAETVAEAITPTNGIGKMKVKDQPDYSEDRLLLTKNVAKVVAGLVAAASGMDATQVSIVILSATTSLDSNFEHSAKNLKDESTEIAEEEKDDETAKENTPALTINGAGFDLIDHVDNHPGMRKRSLSLTSLYLHEQKTQAEVESAHADGWWNKCLAADKVDRAKQKIAARPFAKSAGQAKDYAVNNPGKTTACVAAAALTGGAAFAPTILTGLGLGAAGGFVGSMANHDFAINSTKDAASIAISTALGGLMPAPAKLFFSASVATGVYGYATDAPDLMWEGIGGAAFSFVPFVRELRAATKNVSVASSHFTRSLDDLMLKPAVNSNNPVRPTANLNYMSVPQSLTQTEVNGIEQLAQKMSGGSGGAGIKSTTMSGSSSTPKLPIKDSIIMYGHRKDSTGQLIETAIGIKGKERDILNLAKSTKGLIEGADEATAAYMRMKASRASPTSVARDGVNIPKPSAAWREVQAAKMNIDSEKLIQLEQSLIKGEYNKVKGHHVHAKKAFEGHANYDPKKGFSISDELMSAYGIKHSTITGSQQKLFNELAKSGRPNTIYEHSRIAVEALVEAGMPENAARSIVAESLSNLRVMNVRNPVNIPWN